MSERVEIDRKQGDPLVFHVDLKWALWSTNESLWADYAPETYSHLKAGFDGYFDEYGDTIVVHTAPRKEIRFGTVTIDPKADRVTVEFRSEFDDDSVTSSGSFPLPETLEEFMAKVDEVEEWLIFKEHCNEERDKA